MPDARCTRGLVCKWKKKTHTSIQGSGGNPTFPAQWLYGLYRALPGESGLVASVACEYGCQRPVGMTGLRRLDANHRGVRTTRFCRTQHPSTPKASPGFKSQSAEALAKAEAPFVSPPYHRSRETRPAITGAPDAAASTAPRPASLTIRIRPFGGTGWREYRGDLASEKQKYFFGRDWTGQIRLIWLRKLDFWRDGF